MIITKGDRIYLANPMLISVSPMDGDIFNISTQWKVPEMTRREKLEWINRRAKIIRTKSRLGIYEKERGNAWKKE